MRAPRRDDRMNSIPMVSVAIEKIHPNPYRDFTLNPYHDGQLQKLRDSYRENGDFGIIPVRRMPDGSYQQACGHHRIKAMKAENFVTADVKILDMTDGEMVRRMIAENATQFGDHPQAQADSVAAMASLYTYWMLTSDDAAGFNKLASVLLDGNSVTRVTLFEEGNGRSGNGFKVAKSALIKHADVGVRSLQTLMGDSGLGKNILHQKLGEMKESGHIKQVVDRALDRFNAEVAEQRKLAEAERIKQEAAEKRRQQEEAEEKKRLAELAAEKKRIAAEQKAAKEEAEKRRLAREEERRLEREREALEREEARKVLHQRELERLEREKEAEAKRKEREAAAQALRIKAAEAEANKVLNPDVLGMFENTTSLRFFREQVKSKPHLYPIDDQPDIARRMLDALGDEVTSKGIRAWMMEEAANRDGILKEQLRKLEEEKQREAESTAISNKARRIKKELAASIGRLFSVMREFDKEADNAEFLEAFVMAAGGGSETANQLAALHRGLPFIAEKLGIAESRISKTIHVEKEIN